MSHMLEEAFSDVVEHVDAFNCQARLSGIDHGSPHRGFSRQPEIGIGVDDEDILATALHQHWCETLCAAGHYAPAGGSRSGKCHFVDLGLA
jgi:hypothetical protein